MKKFLPVLALALMFAGLAQAQIDNIEYPVPELGNCKSQAACKTYCNIPENKEDCLNFAERHNLMNKQEIVLARKMVAGEIKGPGGCTNKEECEAHCDDISRITECLSFAEENNLIPPGDLEEARKAEKAIKEGVKPPACKNKKDCDAYCADPANLPVCMNFALKAGLMKEEERVQAEKMLGAIEKGFRPPPCRGKEECEAYCSQEQNSKECTDFARAAGMMSEEQLREMKEGGRQFREMGPGYKEDRPQFQGDEPQYRRGEPPEGMMRGPGGCQNPEECEAFCRSNPEECGKFGDGERREMPPEQFRPEGEEQFMREGREQFMERREEGMPPFGEGMDYERMMPAGEPIPMIEPVPIGEPEPQPVSLLYLLRATLIDFLD